MVYALTLYIAMLIFVYGHVLAFSLFIGALSVGGLLLLTGFGIGYTAIIAAVEAAALSNLVSQHYLDLITSGDYLKILLEYFNIGGGGGSAAGAAGGNMSSLIPDASATAAGKVGGIDTSSSGSITPPPA